MGSTVIAGAATSLSAGFFLTFCQTSSLNTFGNLMIVTVISSVITALIILPAILYTIGPEGYQGKVSVFYHSIQKKLKR